jgi:nucleoid DNA-binding protein
MGRASSLNVFRISNNNKEYMSKKSTKSVIKCRATRRHLLNGTETNDLQGIRVTVAYPQKRTLRDMAKSINNACSASVADVLAVWNAMEDEIIRILSNGDRVELGTLGTLSLEVGTKQRKSINEGVTSKDIVAKSITFAPSKRLTQEMSEFTFECDGVVSHPLSEENTEEVLTEHFSKHPYINARTFATICKCSRNTTYRRIAKMVADGKLKQNSFAPGMYELVSGKY